MTTEQAITILSNATFSEEWQGNEELTTAYHMAMEALDDAYKDEIVSCKDCKHQRLASDDIGAYKKCKKHGGIWGDYDFCSKGEREESDDE